MTEPTYEYVKGQGWVAMFSDKWCVIYRYDNSGKWWNAVATGRYHKYKEAEREYTRFLIDYASKVSSGEWEFKLIPYESIY